MFATESPSGSSAAATTPGKLQTFKVVNS